MGFSIVCQIEYTRDAYVREIPENSAREWSRPGNFPANRKLRKCCLQQFFAFPHFPRIFRVPFFKYISVAESKIIIFLVVNVFLFNRLTEVQSFRFFLQMSHLFLN